MFSAGASGVCAWRYGLGFAWLFCLWVTAGMNRGPGKLVEMLEPVVEGLGYEMLGIEHVKQGKDSVLRVYIDREGGIKVEDCTLVSHQVSGVLDVEGPLPGHYVLEVSSPGVERPLFLPCHFRRFVGHQVKLRMRGEFQGRRKVTGHLKDASGDDKISVVDQGEELIIPYQSIASAHLVAEFK